MVRRVSKEGRNNGGVTHVAERKERPLRLENDIVEAN
jgi:hypothetical protein